jgi:hypothetical protein
LAGESDLSLAQGARAARTTESLAALSRGRKASPRAFAAQRPLGGDECGDDSLERCRVDIDDFLERSAIDAFGAHLQSRVRGRSVGYHGAIARVRYVKK